ncbi:hypothetical protein Droror1_Dr00028036 [Drosera rotundifolia]
MLRRRLLVLLKPLEAYSLVRKSSGANVAAVGGSEMLRHLDNRLKVHTDAVTFCQDVLKRKMVDWETNFCNSLYQPISNMDLVVTVGGDGTLLQASHFMDDSLPVLGVNSDPTQVEEVEEFSDEFDATRSTGYLCAATVKNFEEVLDNILENRSAPSEISRISVHVNSKLLPTPALNDLLIAHRAPAAVSRFSFGVKKDENLWSSKIICRSSGLRVCTAAGSSAAMLSAGGLSMPIFSKDLQYMVREPILPSTWKSSLMHGFVRSGQKMEIVWSSDDGEVYIDGFHISYPVRIGDVIDVSSEAPVLRLFLPHHLSSQSCL